MTTSVPALRAGLLRAMLPCIGKHYMSTEELSPQEILPRITKLVSEQLGIEQDSISAEQSLETDLGCDILDLIELVMALEDEFEIGVSGEDGYTIATISDAVAFVQKLKSSAQSKIPGA